MNSSKFAQKARPCALRKILNFDGKMGNFRSCKLTAEQGLVGIVHIERGINYAE